LPASQWPAANFRQKPVVDAETWIGLAREGIICVPAECRALNLPDVLGAA